ncbi:hypothetical protein MIPYR_30186 [uncultured Microbacterium sp.]|uniref:Uncharacterized protein n=1 Tax=uncultured Microbacterium sp. TaxID=191216 RepID=A0A1Y5P225_9MICO|nr:hypothetical protein MIPYR_30186 [uncultured Microbacterium sp.]
MSGPRGRATRNVRHGVRRPQTCLWITVWTMCEKRRHACAQRLCKTPEVWHKPEILSPSDQGFLIPQAVEGECG